MKERIRQIMESQHMTQQVFADYIGIGAATLSSIFNGRTRPTLNIVEAIKKKIPNINIDWLVLGSGDMYQPHPSDAPVSAKPDADRTAEPVSGQSSTDQMILFDDMPSPTPQSAPPQYPPVNSVRNTRPEIGRMEVKVIDKPKRRVKEIRVFYDDQTWETFVPEK